MDGFTQWFGNTLFLFLHLLDQKIHGSFCNHIDLLSDCLRKQDIAIYLKIQDFSEERKSEK